MAIGFVLTSTAPSTDHPVHTSISKIKAIPELHPFFVVSNLIAKAKADDLSPLSKPVTNKIRTVSGVVDTGSFMGITL